MAQITLNLHKSAFNEYIYKDLTNYDTMTEVYYGGASSGKSHGVLQKVIIKALDPSWKKKRKVLFLRKVGATVYDSIFTDVISVLSDLEILPYCKVNKSSYRIELPNKAEFIFKGLDDPEKIKSIKGLSDIVMEEASEFTHDDYTQLKLRLRERTHKNRQVFLMFNPVSKVNWTYKTFFEGQKPRSTKVIHSSYKDNTFLDEEVILELEDLSRTNTTYYKIYALGEFATLDKLIFPDFTKTILNKGSMSDLPSYIGLDFGYTNDPSALVHIKVDEKTKTLYFMEEYTKKGMLNDEIASVIRKLGFAKDVITADSAEKKSIAEIREHGIPRIRGAKKGKNSILQGIQFIQQYKLVVDERCVKLIEELENYTWQKDKKSGEYTNTPVDSYNHLLDASRYALEEYKGYAQGGVKPGQITRNISRLKKIGL